MEGAIQQTRNFITFLHIAKQMEVSRQEKLWGRTAQEMLRGDSVLMTQRGG